MKNHILQKILTDIKSGKIDISEAEKLIKNVRDNTIKSCDSQLLKESNSPIAKRWRELVNSGNINELQKTLIVNCIDDTLFHLLDAIDKRKININYITNKNETINLSEAGLGEMAGSYASNNWIEQFSDERFSDDKGLGQPLGSWLHFIRKDEP